jgi:hypothetical protein
MESSGAQISPERRRSFDVMASVDMLRFDLQRFGQVLPETRQRVYDEELSSIAEGVERAARTEFVLAKEGDDLVYFDRGSWKSYTGMLITGNQVAHLEASADPRREFLAQWSDRDLEVGYALRKLQPGDVMVWTNGYPHEIGQKYGDAFMRDCGLFPDRKMGFVYRAECLDEGGIVLQSQTLDGSDADGLAAVERLKSEDPAADIGSLIDAYDNVLNQRLAEPVYAGRTAAQRGENAWQEILAHKDLITAMLDGLEGIAALDIPRRDLERHTIRHIVGVWKAFKRRLHAETAGGMTPGLTNPSWPADVWKEIRYSYQLAHAQGDLKVGCGGAVRTENDSSLDPNNPVDLKETFDSIFGDEKSGWKWKQGVCRVKACPTRPGKTRVGPCEVCVRCQAKFDSGNDPTKTSGAVSETERSESRFDVQAELAKMFKQVTASESKAKTGYELVA